MIGQGPSLTVLQHVPQEPPGRIAMWALENGLGLERVRVWLDDPLPEAGELDGLVVLGGPMGVGDGDAHPWLEAELALIREAVDAGAPVLGVCLGAQLIAEALGGAVEPMDEREVGVFEVQPTDVAGDHPLADTWPKRFGALHWHGDRFRAPEQATVLAASKACDQQAFAVGEQVLGLQFHLELEPRDVQALAEADPDAIEPGPWVQPVEEIEGALEDAASMYEILDATLEAWAPSP